MPRERTAPPQSGRPKAVVLLSGGMDSATTLALAKDQGFDTYTLTVRYGQRHGIEIDAAAQVAKQLEATAHAVVDVDLAQFGGSALTAEIPVPKDRIPREMSHGIPATYVPARNTVFLSLALAWAETLGATDIFIGANVVDYSGYPDCRPEYLEAYERMANLATRAAVEGGAEVEVHAPLLHMTKAEIVQRGMSLGVDFGLTVSCYDPSPDGAACGRCDACVLRIKAFEDAGLEDPVRYRR